MDVMAKMISYLALFTRHRLGVCAAVDGRETCILS